MKIEKRVVDKKRGIVQITCPDERWYQVDENKAGTLSQEDFYPSVTWIGSYYPKTHRYLRWLAEKGWDEAEAIKNAAAEKGSRVHHASADLMKGIEVKIDAKYPNSEGEMAELTAEEYGIVMTFQRFLEEEQPIILALDYTLLNHKDRYGGTIDMKCRIKSDEYKFIHIIDIKTSQEIWPPHELQLSAYKEADPKCEKIDIVQVGYRRTQKGWKFTPVEPQYDVFLAAKRIWRKETEGVLVPQRDYPLSLRWQKEAASIERKKPAKKKVVKVRVKKLK